MVDRDIPFVDPAVGQKEIEAVKEVIASKNLVEGTYTHSFETKFAAFSNVKHAIACNNGTSALHLAMEASPIQPGEEVITTPFTFIATSNSILFTGAVPKFVDIDTETWNLDPEKIEDAITENTKAIMPVHIFGLAADMPAIRDIADDNDLFIIEDAAQAHGAKINGQHVGGFGDIGTFSLYVTKNLIAGEGGVVTTNDDELADTVISLKNHGRTPRGGYEHIRVGYNFRLADFAGAIADTQMDKIEDLLAKRATNAKFYRKIIDEIDGLDYQHVPKGFDHGNYIFAIDTRNHEIKPTDAVQKLKEHRVLARPIYSTLSYQQASFKRVDQWRWAKFVDYPDYSKEHLAVSEAVATNHFEIPVVPSLSDEEREHVGQALYEIFQ